MIDERPRRLMTALESRLDALLEQRLEQHVQYQALQNRLAELEQGRQALEARNAELQARAEAGLSQRDELEGRLRALEAKLAESEGLRLELAEENRELDEQNRELEAHAHRLQQRLDDKAPAEPVAAPHRQARGLSALMGHHRATVPEQEAATEQEPVATEEPAAAEPAAAAGAQSDLPIGEAPSPQALLAQWYQRYGDAFFKGHTRPLKVGIHEDLNALEPWPEKLVRRALACYVNLPRYLKSVREGAERIDLNGAPAGIVDRGAADHAHKKLERLQAERQRKGKSARSQRPRKPRAERRDASSERVAAPSDLPSSSSPSQAVAAERASPDEPADDRIQRKLGELMARHNGR
ncbi:ProQ/FINO family protein [Halomonas getboli]|uniref:ProQ/FINO family protein n=1 Tax=Halomonas getboli TaxID=2935862 RepID=UPI0020000C4B|nr:ProQ/FINO family protein [Halomonas getboli]MCK2184403.1 ProQ/FINO family protein [Halomonas getboli]